MHDTVGGDDARVLEILANGFLQRCEVFGDAFGDGLHSIFLLLGTQIYVDLSRTIARKSLTVFDRSGQVRDSDRPAKLLFLEREHRGLCER